jgi:hypothetical protein
MNLSPFAIGAKADALLKESKLQPQTFAAGSYVVTGPFFIQASHVTLIRGIDSVGGWAETTLQWRYFNQSAGSALTLQTSSRMFVASANLIVNTSTPTSSQLTPAWLAGTKVAITWNGGSAYSGSYASSLAVSPMVQYYDSPSGSWGTSGLVTMPNDTLYDVFAHTTIPVTWQQTTVTPTGTECTVIQTQSAIGGSPPSSTFSFGCEAMLGQARLFYLFAFSTTAPIATYSGPLFSAFGSGIYQGVFIGPFAGSGDTYTVGQACINIFTHINVPAWVNATASPGFPGNPNYPTQYVGVGVYDELGNLLPGVIRYACQYASNYAGVPGVFQRTSQQLVGSAPRNS